MTKLKDGYQIHLSNVLLSMAGKTKIRQILDCAPEYWDDAGNIFAVEFDKWLLCAKPISSINPCAPPEFYIKLKSDRAIDNQKSEASIFKRFKKDLIVDDEKLKYAIKLAKKIIKILEGKYDRE